MVVSTGKVLVPNASCLGSSGNFDRVGVTNGGLFNTAASCKVITSAHRNI